jgi:hypothetical protein
MYRSEQSQGEERGGKSKDQNDQKRVEAYKNSNPKMQQRPAPLRKNEIYTRTEEKKTSVLKQPKTRTLYGGGRKQKTESDGAFCSSQGMIGVDEKTGERKISSRIPI